MRYSLAHIGYDSMNFDRLTGGFRGRDNKDKEIEKH